MPRKANQVATKTIFLSPSVHLRLKVLATCGKMTMGEFIGYLLDRFEPGQTYTVDQDLEFLKHLEMFAKAEQDKAVAAKINNLEIRTEEAQ